jgi:nucleoside-diphosphate-sugar epimerase
MKSAIITGATGFIGSHLVKLLLENNIEVLALGRKDWNDVDHKRLAKHKKLTYLRLNMDEIENLPSEIDRINWIPSKDCVFFNFAWWGKLALSDLEINFQLQNVSWSANALVSAQEIGCNKFIHVGTMEEAFTKKYLDLNYHVNSEYNRHVIYSVSKMTSRNLLKMMSAERKISLIVATNSHVMGSHDDKDSFLQVTLQKLINKDDLIFSTCEQYFDVISAEDCASAYKLIGEKGKPGSEYWVGSGEARPLKEYVLRMAELYPSGKRLQFGHYSYNDISLKKADFNIDNLIEDTGFKPNKTYEATVKDLYYSLISTDKTN